MQAAAARLGVELIKQYPAREQVELKVKVQIPGSWFGGLTAAERAVKYWAQAAESADAHKFSKQGQRAAETCAALRFLCESDVSDQRTHVGFWIRLAEWNRYRNDTYKEDNEAELPFIRTAGEDAAAAAPAAAAPAASTKAVIFNEFAVVTN